MAKQSGLHQIRGKVGEHSYYRQSGVKTGLIRSINQGMSSRVKTADEYVNTRLNNAEFGQACRIAASYIRLITPKFRPMILTFSQAKVAKMVLEQLKLSNADWGKRNFADANGDTISSILNTIAKNNFDEYGVKYVLAGDESSEPAIQIDGVQSAAKAAELGCDGYQVKVILGEVAIGNYQATERKYATTRFLGNSATIAIGQDMALEETIVLPASLEEPPSPAAGAPVTANRVLVLVVMPFRSMAGGTTTHILQEACTFKVLPWNVYSEGE